MPRVVLGETVEEATTRHVGDRRAFVAEMHSVGLHAVLMFDRRTYIHIVDEVRARLLFEHVTHGHEARRIRKDHGFAFVRIKRCEQRAFGPEAADRHRFDHHVDVARMIEVLVRERDRVEVGGIAGWDGRGRAHERTRARIDVDLRRTSLAGKCHPHAARRANLLRDHEPGTGRTEKANGDHRASVLRG